MGSFVLVFQQLLMIYGMFCSAACLSFPLSTLPVSLPSPFQLLLPPVPNSPNSCGASLPYEVMVSGTY